MSVSFCFPDVFCDSSLQQVSPNIVDDYPTFDELMTTVNIEKFIDYKGVVISKEEYLSNLDVEILSDERDNIFLQDNSCDSTLQQFVSQEFVDDSDSFEEDLELPPDIDFKITIKDSTDVQMPRCSSLSNFAGVVYHPSNSSLDGDTSSSGASLEQVDQIHISVEEKALTLPKIVPSSSTLHDRKALRNSGKKHSLKRDFASVKDNGVRESKVLNTKSDIIPCPSRGHAKTEAEVGKKAKVINLKRHSSESESSNDSTVLRSDQQSKNFVGNHFSYSAEERKRIEEREERLKTRNRLAARRCRGKQKNRLEQLQKEADQISEENKRIREKIKNYRKEIRVLTDILKHHDCVMGKGGR